jgi:hypothetical protein
MRLSVLMYTIRTTPWKFGSWAHDGVAPEILFEPRRVVPGMVMSPWDWKYQMEKGAHGWLHGVQGHQLIGWTVLLPFSLFGCKHGNTANEQSWYSLSTMFTSFRVKIWAVHENISVPYTWTHYKKLVQINWYHSTKVVFLKPWQLAADTTYYY